MAHQLAMIEFSCKNAVALAAFWSEMLGIPVDEGATEAYAQLTPTEPLPKVLFVQREPGGNTESLVLALLATDLEAEVNAAVQAGARSHGIQHQDRFIWATLSDPEGNRFTLNLPPPQ